MRGLNTKNLWQTLFAISFKGLDGESRNIFIPLVAAASMLALSASCAQVPMREAKVTKARYVAPRALGDFKEALAADGRDWHKHGVYVETLEDGEPVAMLNEGKLFNPASVIKLATSLAALNKLGPNRHFHTDFLANGEIYDNSGELDGDLILFSGRDPSFSMSDAKRVGEALRRFGVWRVNGSLIVIGDFYCNFNPQTDVSASVFVKHCGIAFRHPIRYENYNSQPRGRLLITVESDSLLRIAQYQNAHSVNSMAEILADHISGPQYVESFLTNEVGISPDAIKISTGSGLNKNRMSPHDTVRMLRAMVNWLEKYGLKPDAVMGMAGIDPGTMRGRFSERAFAGSIIAKTGTLTTTDNGMANLAGVMHTRDRGTLLFAVYDNAESRSIKPLRKIQDDFLKNLMNELGGPVPDRERSLMSNGDRLQSRLILADYKY